MNWLLIAVILFLAYSAYKGHKDGFIRTVFSVFSVIAALILSGLFSPVVGKAVRNNKKIYNTIEKHVSKNLKLDKDMKKKSGQKKAIEKLSLPGSLKTALIENNNDEIYRALKIDDFKKYVSHYITNVIINSGAYLVTFFLIITALFILANALNLITRLPVINGLNKTAGFLTGILKGLVLLWIFCILLTTVSGTKFGLAIYGMINDSWILSRIYDNNLLLKGVTDMAKILFI